jgi:cyanophycinase-like exopeptidase
MTFNLFSDIPAIAVVASISILITILLFRRSATHQVKVHTLAFNKEHSEDKKLMAAYSVLRSIPDKHIVNFARENRDSREASDIRIILNHWERAAIGIKHSIYYEPMLIESYKVLVSSIRKKTKNYIALVQIDSPKAYENFELMAARWDKIK